MPSSNVNRALGERLDGRLSRTGESGRKTLEASRTRPYGAAAVIVLGILSPNVKVLGALPTLRGEDAVLVCLLLFSTTFRGVHRRVTQESQNVGKAFAFMGALALASLLLSPLLYGTTLLFNDLMYFPMLFRCYLIYRVGQAVWDVRDKLFCLVAALFAFGLSACLGVFQMFDLAAVNEWATPLYTDDAGGFATSGGAMVSRVTGTHADPRFFGAMLVCGLAVILPMSLRARGTTTKIASAVLIPVSLLAMIGTLSRTAVYSAIIVGATGAWILFRRRVATGALALVIAAGAVGLTMLQYFGPSDTHSAAFRERVLTRDTDSYEMSAAARQRDLKTPFLEALNNVAIFAIGRGPAKADLRTSMHSDIGWYFIRFGLPGLTFYMLLLVWGIRRSYSLATNNKSPLLALIYTSTGLVILNWAIFTMAESVFKDSQMMTINMFFLGLAHSWTVAPRNVAPMGKALEWPGAAQRVAGEYGRR